MNIKFDFSSCSDPTYFNKNYLKYQSQDEYIKEMTKQLSKISFTQFEPNDPKSKSTQKASKVFLEIPYSKMTKLAQMTEQEDSSNLPTQHPLITFHGTSGINTAQSICNHGYLLTNDTHPTKGFLFRMQNGNVQGDGVYHSHKTDFAKQQDSTDAKGKSYLLIVNFVSLGTIQQSETDYQNDKNYPWNQIDRFVNKNGDYFDTIINDCILLSANSQNVIPIGMVVISPNFTNDIEQMNICSIEQSQTMNLNKLQYEQALENIRREKIKSYHVCLDQQQVDLSSIKNQKKKTQIMIHLYQKSLSIENQNILKSFVNRQLALGHRIICWYEKGNIIKNTEINNSDSISDISLNTTDKSGNIRSVYFSIYDIICTNYKNYLNILQLIITENKQLHSGQEKDFYLIDYHINTEVMIKIKNIELCRITNNNQVYLKLTQDTIHTQDQIFYSNYLYDISFEEILMNTEEENENLYFYSHTPIAIPFAKGFIGEGFTTDLLKTPLWDTQCGDGVIQKGRNLRQIKVGNDQQAIDQYDIWTEDKIVFEENEVKFNPRKTDGKKERHEQLEKMDAIQKETRVRGKVKAFKGIIDSINVIIKAFEVRMLTSKAVLEMNQMMVQRLTENLLKRLNFFSDYPFLTKSETATYYQRLNKFQRDSNTLLNVKFDGELFKKLGKMRFFSKLIKRSLEIDIESVTKQSEKKRFCLDRNLIKKQPQEVLNHIQNEQMGVYARYSDMSNSDPWTVMVTLVSRKKFTIKQMQETVSNGENSMDQDNQPCNGTIIPMDDKSDIDPMVKKMYNAWIITKNPYLIIPGQQAALNTSSLCNILDSILQLQAIKKNQLEINQEFAEFKIDQAKDLMNSLKDYRLSAQMEVIRDNILENTKSIENQITTKQQISSLTLLVPILLKDDCSILFNNNENQSTLCLALMKESIKRNCKVLLKRYKITAETELNNCFQFNENSILQNQITKSQYEHLQKYTSKFQSKKWDNFSPFTVVAFLQSLKSVSINKNIKECFMKKEIGMKVFLKENYSETGKITQIALQLYGIINNLAQDHDDINHDVMDSNQIYKIQYNQYHIYLNKLSKMKEAQNKLSQRVQQRLMSKVEKHAIFKEQHKTFKLFTEKEVVELNKHRRVEKLDLLELTDSGFLKFQCCQVDCPYQLKTFKKLGEQTLNKNYRRSKPGSRSELFRKHLDLDKIQRDQKVCSLARKAKTQLKKQDQCSQEAFQIQMETLKISNTRSFDGSLTYESFVKNLYSELKRII